MTKHPSLLLVTFTKFRQYRQSRLSLKRESRFDDKKNLMFGQRKIELVMMAAAAAAALFAKKIIPAWFFQS